MEGRIVSLFHAVERLSVCAGIRVCVFLCVYISV